MIKQFLVLGRIEEGDQGLSGRQALDFGGFRRAHLGDHIARLVKCCSTVHHRDTSCAIGIVGKTGSNTGPGFYQTGVAEFR
ncbi:hypothetical protein D3C80_2149310 [compost metagenome]